MKEPRDESNPNPLAEPTAIELPTEVELKLQKKERSFSWAGMITIGTLGLIGTAGLLMPSMARAKGATVSAQLKWADRNAEIQIAIERARTESEDPK